MVEISIPFSFGASLEINSRRGDAKDYPTTRLQKGFAVVQNGQSLVEEGVGFGVPVIKRRTQTIFPGHMDLDVKMNRVVWVVTTRYRMDLVEKIALPGKGRVENRLVYILKNSLAGLHRRIPAARKFLTATSNNLRRYLGVETIFAEVGSYGTIDVVFTIYADLGRILFEFDTSGLHKDLITEIVIMNEQGASTFDLYQDTNGNSLRADEIGTWDEVSAEEASFISSAYHLAFTIQQVEGARLFRGRELIGSRLAWAGFGYSLPVAKERFCYELRLQKYP